MNLGGHTNMTTQRQKTKVYYLSVVSKARQHSNIDKDMAIRYFTKQKACQRISANKSYADALKFGKDTFAKVKTNPLPPIHIKNSDLVKQGVPTRTVKIPANRVNATTCFNKIYKQESPVHITLHDRFDALNIIDTTDEVDMPSVCPYVTKMHILMMFSRIPIHLGASLTGLGGHFDSMVYSLPIPLGFMDYTIVHLEILNIVVAAKISATHWSNQKVQIFCDNMAVVEVDW